MNLYMDFDSDMELLEHYDLNNFKNTMHITIVYAFFLILIKFILKIYITMHKQDNYCY